MQRLYDDNMYRFSEPQPSYWEATAGSVQIEPARLKKDDSCDVAIIGGGYTGLSAAYHLARDYQIDVRVLEAGHIGWGASGRNGGFCSVGGSALEFDNELARYGIDNVRHYYQTQVDAVELVRQIIKVENIYTPLQGNGELEVAHSLRAFDHLKNHAEKQFRLLGLDTKVFSADAFRDRFFDSSELYGGVRLRPTFGLHPLRFVLGLAAAAVRAGAHIHSHTEVVDWTHSGDRHVLTTEGGSLRAKQVVMATNGFMPEYLHRSFRGVPLPMISAIIVTRPLTGDELSAHQWRTEDPSINTREVLNYFRLLPDGRFLFGGRGHARGSDKGALQVFRNLRAEFRRQWPLWYRVDIDYRWHGLICMTRRRTPCVGRLEKDPSVFYAFGYHGNGVNTSTWSGKQIADWLGRSAGNGSKVPASLPLMVRGLSPRFPLASLRLAYLRVALAWKRYQDQR